MKLTTSTIVERLDERAQELAHRLLDDARLVCDLVDLDADRNLSFGIRNRILEPLAELQNVGAFGHGDDDTDGFAAVMAHDAARRVLVSAFDGGDIAEPEGHAARLDGNLRDSRRALKRTGDAHVDSVGIGLDAARGRDRILARHAVEDGLGSDAKRRELTVAELDEDALLAHADNVDLGNSLRPQQALAHDLRIILELGERNVGARQHVDGGVDVAVLVVEEGSLHALRQRRAAVGELLAHLVPGVIDFLRPRRILELHLNDSDARPGVGLDVVEKLELLKALLELVGDLILHLLGGGAWPCRADHHRLNRERGILGAAEAQVTHEPRHREHDDEEQNESGMCDRPGGEIAARGGVFGLCARGHCTTSTIRTGVPASSL